MAKQKERLARLWGKAWVRWLCGYLAVLFCGVGLVYYWRVIYKLGEGTPGFAATTTLIICGGFTAVFLLVLLAAHFLKQKLWLKTAVLLAIAGLCFVFANPPLQAPDETDHFVRAYAIGSGHWDFDEQETYPDDVHALVRYFNGSAAHAGEGGLLGSFARYKASLEKKDVHTGAFSNALQIVAYLPQAVGVAIGRLFSARAMACMYLARCANVLLYAAACGLAVQFARRFQPILIAVMMNPLALFIAGSCSPDGLFLSLSWVFIGICLSDGITARRLALLSVSFGLAFYSKFTALALLPLIFLLPYQPERLRFGKRLRPLFWRLMLIAVCLFAAVVSYAVQSGYVSLFSNYKPMAYFDPNIDPARQVRFIFSNPARYAAVFCYTLYRDQFSLFTLGKFGQLDVDIPLIDCLSPLVLLFAAGCASLEGARETKRTGWSMGGSAALLYAFTYTGMYLTCTPATLPEINGVQSRYLLTGFFALLVLAAMLMGRTMALHDLRSGKPQKTPPAWRVLHLTFLYAVACALLLFQRYYIGA